MGSTSGIWVFDQLVRAQHEERLARSAASSAVRRSRRARGCPLRAVASVLAGCRRAPVARTAGPLTGGGRA